MAEAGEVARGLAIIEGLAEHLSGFQPWHAARAALLTRMGRVAEASEAYDRAIAMASGPAEALFLKKRLGALEGPQ